MKDTIASLQKEEEELEKKLFSTPEETAEDTETKEPTAETLATEENPGADETLADGKELVTPEQKPATDEQGDPKIEPEENWELRYKNLRASRDQKLYDTKRQLSAALATISTLQTQVSELQQMQPKVDPLEGVFTEEDKENLGEGTVDALQKATRKATEAATARLEKELQAQKDLRAKEAAELAESTKKDAYDLFIARIANAVPNWEAINYEKGFEDFLMQPDLDGNQRKSYFTQAEAQGNAALIIRYMKEYEATKPKPEEKKDPLASKVTPTGESAGTTHHEEGKEETISQAFIDKFYDDLNRGRYEGKYSERKAIEDKIDKAVMERRIVM